MKKVISYHVVRMLTDELNCFDARGKRLFDFERVEDDIFADEHPLKLGINWSCIGCTDAARALQFAAGLQKGAEFAQAVNELGAVWRYESEAAVDREAYWAERHALSKMVIEEDYVSILEWLRNRSH